MDGNVQIPNVNGVGARAFVDFDTHRLELVARRGEDVADVGLRRGGGAHVGMVEGDGELRGGGPEDIGHDAVEIRAGGEVIEVDLLRRVVHAVRGEGVGDVEDRDAV